MMNIIYNLTTHHDTLQIAEVVRTKFAIDFVLDLLKSKDFMYIKSCLKIIGNFVAVN